MSDTDTSDSLPPFSSLGLHEAVLEALDAVGYETPTPIQARAIPPLLEGRDLLGQAQTGTGKTAAFALPLLSRLEAETGAGPQVLVLTPTRELAIQVAEAFHRYASKLPGFRVAPIYGGQSYNGQLRQLRRGVHVVVGTPGRVMDHMRRGTLDLGSLSALVLDEADEMLRMGFIDDVEWILEQTPKSRQIALFSATLAKEVRRIADRHLDNPVEITLESKATTATTIRQRYWKVGGLHKLDALTRILEAEDFDAMIVFVRTKVATVEVAEKLDARGFDTAAINGDMPQPQRERVVEKLRRGDLDILVATDVAARGLDVDRVSHVVNYDIPWDTDSYVHRVGRTGRAGREGEAILFVSPRERRMLQAIERATGQPIERMEMPSKEVVNDRRIERFEEKITETLAEDDHARFHEILSRYQSEHDVPALDIAAALAQLLNEEDPIFFDPKKHAEPRRDERGDYRGGGGGGGGGRFRDSGPPPRGRSGPPPSIAPAAEPGMERYRIDVGYAHGVQPGNIVGAIANEGGIEGKRIGKIDIQTDFSTVDLPENMPEPIYRHLQHVVVRGQKLNLTKIGEDGKPVAPPPSEGQGPRSDSPAPRRPPRPSRDGGGGHAPRRKFRPKPRRDERDARGGDRPKPRGKGPKGKGPKGPKKPHKPKKADGDKKWWEKARDS